MKKLFSVMLAFIMIQWIWRSAIRDGGEVYLYIPSSRMRMLLINWIDEISNTV